MLLNDESLTIPFVIDGMDNAVNQAYKAWPDRVFLVRTDGRLAVAATRGPWGFGPGVNAAKEWLAKLWETGEEPALPDDASEAGAERHIESASASEPQDESQESGDEDDGARHDSSA